jgi:uncharacterized membrane protein
MVGMSIARTLKHWFYIPRRVRKHFPPETMATIQKKIADSERLHLGEVRFAVEGALPWRDALDGISARDRALQLFSELRIWDTYYNNGVLIYLLLAEHDVEIVADRDIHTRVGQAGWEDICHAMEHEFRQGRFEAGVLLGLERITTILREQYPSRGQNNHNELPDEPIVV